ncbi:S8 family serine peptidase [Deinococcus hopiensis]|uniref:Serine protease, subtilisin family n=1 Tax=Deinococcus hopiensis KR-140 TaxID=695939 RepID=A0A1W1VS48_9DEIO|nr:S8 family serine peptidase [Deinococcus hopiensis]SMB96169.1 Serine protease, subtilisin family [Deinococcus hopiensis KR-140]
MKRMSLAALALTALLAACGQQTTSPVATAPGQTAGAPARPADSQIDPAQVVTTKSGEMYVRNQLVAKLQGEDAAALAASLGGRVLDQIPELNVALIELPAGKDARAVGVALMRQGQVLYASAQNVERREAPVHHDAVGAQAVNQVFDQLPQYALDANHLHAKAAWDMGYTGQGVKVGVVDDPVDVSHPDLRPNWAGKAYDPVTNTTYTDVQSWIDAIDAFDGKLDQKVDAEIEHGTAVASTIAAAKDGKGIAGVAPGAKFYSAAIFEPGFIGDYYVARGVIWSVNQGVQVLNNSWGGLGYAPLVKEAFDYALERNVVVVVSAGNSAREEWRNPAQLPGVIASAALDINNDKASFSTFGRHISVAAPGVDVLLASPLFLNANGSRKSGYTAPGGSGYQLISGTSFSGPYTAGAAAVILGAHPELDPHQVRRLMEETADPTVGSSGGFDRETGSGLIRMDKLAVRLKNGPMPDKGGAARVKVEIQTPGGYVPGILADVILEGDGADGAVYGVQTNAEGYANFVSIAPGTYTVRVATPDLSLTGGSPEERDTYVGKLTVTSGAQLSTVAPQRVVLVKGTVNLNPVDPYEPNDTPAQATPITYNAKAQQAYIFGKERDVDYFSFQGAAGDKIEANVYARTTMGGQLDSFLVLRDAAGKKLTFNDDSNGQDSSLTYTLPAAGTYYLEVSSCNILCKSEGDDPSQGTPDDSPFNKYVLELLKL